MLGLYSIYCINLPCSFAELTLLTHLVLYTTLPICDYTDEGVVERDKNRRVCWRVFALSSLSNSPSLRSCHWSARTLHLLYILHLHLLHRRIAFLVRNITSACWTGVLTFLKTRFVKDVVARGLLY